MPPRLSAEERRLAILDAALPLFAAQGDATTTSDIAKAAGVSEALLYKHFSGKAAIYEAIHNRCVAEKRETLDFLEALPNSTSTLVSCTYVLLRRLVVGGDRPDQDENLARLQLHSILDDGSFARTFQGMISAPWLAKLEKCMQAALAAGDLIEGAVPPRRSFWFAHHIAWAARILRLPDPPVIDSPDSAAELLDDIVRFILRGVGLRDEAIAEHFNPQAFQLLLKTSA